MQMVEYKEPILGSFCAFAMIPRIKLKNSPYQRDLSSSLVGKIADSVDKGFVIPLAVVSVDGTEEMFEVIDGQHRLQAADRHSRGETYEVPCIIVPPFFREMPLLLNIEKGDNIRDKATKIHALYMDYVEQHPDDYTEEKLSKSTMYQPYLFTIAFAYQESNVDSPSLVEPIVKKLDKENLVEPLTVAVEIRRARGILAKAVEITINDIASENGITDFNLKKSILSQSSMQLWGRKRNLGVGYEEGIKAVIEVMMATDWSGMQRL